MEVINIAVIGAIGVGKSSFVQRVLRSPRPPNHNVTAFRQEIDGSPHLVTLVELDLEGFEVNPNQPIQWPKQIGGHMVPRMDGALILYDVTNRESIRDLSNTLGTCLYLPFFSLSFAGGVANHVVSGPLELGPTDGSRRLKVGCARGNAPARPGRNGRCIPQLCRTLQNFTQFPRQHA